jgi:hypothetical protein
VTGGKVDPQQNIVFNVVIKQPDGDTAPDRDQSRASQSGRTTYKSAEFQSGLKRVFGVFVPKNVGDLGGVMDPYALLLLLGLCLASVGIVSAGLGINEGIIR